MCLKFVQLFIQTPIDTMTHVWYADSMIGHTRGRLYYDISICKPRKSNPRAARAANKKANVNVCTG